MEYQVNLKGLFAFSSFRPDLFCFVPLSIFTPLAFQVINFSKCLYAGVGEVRIQEPGVRILKYSYFCMKTVNFIVLKIESSLTM